MVPVRPAACILALVDMRVSQRIAAVVAGVMLLTAGVRAQEPLLRVTRAGDSLRVTFDLRPTDTQDLAVRLRGRDPVRVTWHIDVRRAVPFWVDRGVEAFEFTVTARATGNPDVFRIDRTLNQRALGASSTVSRPEAYAALTSFADVELPYVPPADADLPLRVTIRARVNGGGASAIATPAFCGSAPVLT